MTKEELDLEIEEKSEDLDVFRRAYDLIHTRMKMTESHSQGFVTPLYQWSGAIGLKLIMEPLLNNMQRLLDELKQMREENYPDETRTAPPPNLRLIE